MARSNYILVDGGGGGRQAVRALDVDCCPVGDRKRACMCISWNVYCLTSSYRGGLTGIMYICGLLYSCSRVAK